MSNKTAAAVGTKTLGRMLDVLQRNPGKFGLGLAGALGAAGAGEAIIDDIGDILKQKWITTNRPVWEATGQAELLGKNRALMNYVLGQQALDKLKFDLPTDILAGEAKDLLGGIKGQIGGAIRDYKTRKAFEGLEATPTVKALGKEKAKAIYDQISALAPGLTAKAPGVALSAMESAIASGSTALRPEIAKALTETAANIRKQQ